MMLEAKNTFSAQLWNAGKAEGKAEGETKAKIQAIQKMTEDGLPKETILKYLDCDEELYNQVKIQN